MLLVVEMGLLYGEMGGDMGSGCCADDCLPLAPPDLFNRELP